MIPNRLDIIRKSYSRDIHDILKDIGEKLAEVVLPEVDPQNWQLKIPMPRALTHLETFQIQQELFAADWGAVFKITSMTEEYLTVYIPLRT